MIKIITIAFLLSGCSLITTGAFGILRLPDFYCRSHALTKAMTLGITLVLLGAGIHLNTLKAYLVILIAIILQYITIPISSHILGLIAYKKNISRWYPKN